MGQREAYFQFLCLVHVLWEKLTLTQTLILVSLADESMAAVDPA